jgi:toxin ParE1/3/4
VSFQVLLTEDAESDFEAIVTYIAKHDSPQAAQHVLSRIVDIADSLKSAPTRGTAPKELRALGDQEFRQVFFKPYWLSYRVVGKQIVIYSLSPMADGICSPCSQGDSTRRLTTQFSAAHPVAQIIP